MLTVRIGAAWIVGAVFVGVPLVAWAARWWWARLRPLLFVLSVAFRGK